MCIIERRTYLHSDGRTTTVEKARPCSHASGSKLCRDVERRSLETIRTVERRPLRRTKAQVEPDGYIVMNDGKGRQRGYVNRSKHSSAGSSSRGGSHAVGGWSPVTEPSSTSSPPDGGTRPLAPSPPPPPEIFPNTGLPERRRAPYGPGASPPDFTCKEKPDGTAVYELPPELAPSRAQGKKPVVDRRPSGSGPSLDLNRGKDDPEPYETTTRMPFSHSSSSSSKVHTRRSSTHGNPPKGILRQPSQKRQSRHDEKASQAAAVAAAEARIAAEEQRQAEIERQRVARTDRHQSAREAEELARQAEEFATRERDHHRREAREALERRAVERHSPLDETALRFEAELAQMRRERDRACISLETRQRFSSEAQPRYNPYGEGAYLPEPWSTSSSSRRNSRRKEVFAYPSSSPHDRLSPAGSRPGSRDCYTCSPRLGRASTDSPVVTRRPAPAPAVHQSQLPMRRGSMSMRERGYETIARAQAQGARTRRVDWWT